MLFDRLQQGYLNLGINDFLQDKNVSMKVFSREIANKDYRLQCEIYNTWLPIEIIKEVTFIKAVEYNEPMPKDKTVKLANKNNWKYNDTH